MNIEQLDYYVWATKQAYFYINWFYTFKILELILPIEAFIRKK